MQTTPLQLRRAGIGFGTIRIDDTGVSRRSPWTSCALAWDEIEDYRLTIELRGHGDDWMYQYVDWVKLVQWAHDLERAKRGDHACRVGIVLLGASRRLAFDWRFRDSQRAIAHVLSRVGPRLEADARTRFASTGVARFGPLAMTRDDVQWGRRSPLHRDAVECIELFNSSIVQLRVMARGRVFAYGKARTAEIPHLAAALDLAESLGYRVRGREFLPAVSSPPTG